jgi:hypothetical protein
MKKLQLSIFILSFLWISHAFVAVATVILLFDSNYADLECRIQNAPASVESNIADITFLSPDVDIHPYISSDVGREDINLDTDIDTGDPPEESEMNDPGVFLTSSSPKENPVLIVRSLALKVFHFPPEVSRLII